MPNIKLQSDSALTQVIFDQQAHADEMNRYRQVNGADPVAAGQELDDQARQLAAVCMQAAQAVALANGGHDPVPLNPAGEPLGGPVGGLPGVVKVWRDQPTRWPGVVGPVIAAMNADAWRWMKGHAAPDDEQVEVYRNAPRNYKSHLGFEVWLNDPNTAPPPNWRTIPLPSGAEGDRQAEALRRPPAPRAARWLVWSGWPTGWKAPNRTRGPIELRAALPVDRAVIEWQGEQWRFVNFPSFHMLQPVPEWLAEAIGAKHE